MYPIKYWNIYILFLATEYKIMNSNEHTAHLQSVSETKIHTQYFSDNHHRFFFHFEPTYNH